MVLSLGHNPKPLLPLAGCMVPLPSSHNKDFMDTNKLPISPPEVPLEASEASLSMAIKEGDTTPEDMLPLVDTPMLPTVDLLRLLLPLVMEAIAHHRSPHQTKAPNPSLIPLIS
jgi:hypothetical protein